MELVHPESQSANHLALSKAAGLSWFYVLVGSVMGPSLFRYLSLLHRAISKANLEGVHVISRPK